MKCLGCGGSCACKSPATFPTWPLEVSLSHDALESIAAAITEYLSGYETRDRDGELQNVVNIIESFLQRPAETEPTDEDLLS